MSDFKMLPPIKNPADCKVCAVRHFLIAKGFKAPDVQKQIGDVYGEHSMSNRQ